VGKSNRNLMVGGQKKKLALYGRNVLRRAGRWYQIEGLRKRGAYRLALDGRDEQGRRKNKNVPRLASISQLKTRMRQAVWAEAVEDVIKHSHEKPVLHRLEKLLAS